jgi:hypothetical protein
MPKKKRGQNARPTSPDPSTLQMRAEPPSQDGYEAFHNDLPGYLLMKVSPDFQSRNTNVPELFCHFFSWCILFHRLPDYACPSMLIECL